MRSAVALALASVLLAADGSGVRFPAQLTDVDGAKVDVAALASDHRLIVVTLKATWCPVCARQLVRLERLRTGLENCGATFLVLSPGPELEIREVRSKTGFGARYVEDADLAIARSLGLQLGPDQMVPAIFAVNAKLAVDWEQRGRGGSYYGDGRLQKYLGCDLIGT